MTGDSDARTVRELGGEIRSELLLHVGGAREQWNLIEQATEILMGVLARHAGKVIVNDEDMPVTPLPRRFPQE